MQSERNLPDANRLSVISASILLTYAIARLIEIPSRTFAFQLPGFYFELEFNFQIATLLLSTGLIIAGTDWLLRTHPETEDRYLIEHWMLPAFTAWIIGIPILQMPIGPLWWAGFVLGAGFLLLVLVAEYITIDPNDIRHPLAAAALSATAYAIFLTLGISLRFIGLRLFLLLPAIFIATILVSARTLNLRLSGHWVWLDAFSIALLSTQLTAGFHYLPVTPISFGLLILAPTYSLSTLFANIRSKMVISRAIIEPTIILLIILMTALWLS